ncbi:unnamed protein product [Urochloa humidicola]
MSAGDVGRGPAAPRCRRLEGIFEWQFGIIGHRGSKFEGGIYHGRIELPSDYPFEPPCCSCKVDDLRFIRRFN